MRKDQKKIMSIWIVIGFFVFIFVDVLFVSKNILFGIQIKDVNIKDGESYNEEIINVSGNAKNAINLALNSNEIAIDENGNFKETIALSLGYNIITLEAKDKFGNSDKKDYKIIYKN